MANTRKYTFVESRDTRSCIRLHGMGVLAVLMPNNHKNLGVGGLRDKSESGGGGV